MANIAQMVNVLQAMVLTDNEKMVLTPTYYVFRMFKAHQGATMIPIDLIAPANIPTAYTYLTLPRSSTFYRLGF